MFDHHQAEAYLDTALDALSTGNEFRDVLDRLPVPIYTTDSDGAVTYWNRACIDFAGREPQLGEDKWCVTWRIYTTAGEFLPHDQCPMAVAIREQRPIRDEVAIAMRPDGSRVAFRPYPTPFFAANGSLEGAINMLIDVTREQARALLDQAERCRRLSRATHDLHAADALGAMACEFEQAAQALRPTGA
jgi:PAS domain S-box-containing protein